MSAQSNDAGSITLNIAKEFTDSPGGRYRKDGRYSGEEFLDTLLRPAYEKAKAKGQKLVIELDDVYGYPSSFVSGSFGLLASECNQRGVFLGLRLRSMILNRGSYYEMGRPN